MFCGLSQAKNRLFTICFISRSVNKFHIEGGSIRGVDAKCTAADQSVTTKTFEGDAVVLATGHSARDVYYELNESGVELEAKGFAVGFRIEHPQRIINQIQYGKDWGGRVVSERALSSVSGLVKVSRRSDSSTNT